MDGSGLNRRRGRWVKFFKNLGGGGGILLQGSELDLWEVHLGWIVCCNYINITGPVLPEWGSWMWSWRLKQRRLFYCHHFAVEVARYVVVSHSQPVTKHLFYEWAFDFRVLGAFDTNKCKCHISQIAESKGRFCAFKIQPKTDKTFSSVFRERKMENWKQFPQRREHIHNQVLKRSWEGSVSI